MKKLTKSSCAMMAALGLAVALVPLQSGNAAADEGVPEGCVLSDYIPVAGDGVETTYATLSDQVVDRPVDPDDSNYERWTFDVTVGNNSGRDMYEAKLAIGLSVLAARHADNSTQVLPMSYVSQGVARTAEMPVGVWASMSGNNPGVQYTNRATSELGYASYRELNAPTNQAVLRDVAVEVGWDEQVPTYSIGAIAADGSAAGQVTMQVDRPVRQSLRYGISTTELYVAKVCAPNPSIESWVDKDGSRKITGTGSLAGDEIVVTDADGNVVGTTTVGDDLTWSITPAAAFAIGKYALTVTQNDQLFDLVGSAEGVIEVVGDGPSPAATKSPAASTIGLPKTGR